jgi:hypothetical protein
MCEFPAADRYTCLACEAWVTGYIHIAKGLRDCSLQTQFKTWSLQSCLSQTGHES